MGINYLYREHKIWHSEKANLDYRSHDILKWQPLIEQGFIPDKRIPRIQRENGVDTGRFLIPTENCCMNNRIQDTIGYCPVCQLQIIAAISRLSGVRPAWETMKENIHAR